MKFNFKYFPGRVVSSSCAVCGGTDFVLLVLANYPVRLKNGEISPIEILDGACQRCGLVQRIPIPSLADTIAFYRGTSDAVFDLTSEEKFEGDDLSRKIKENQMLYLEAALGSLFPGQELNHIQEIGVFDGAFLLEAKKKGYKVAGFEPSAHCEVASRKLGVDIKNEFFTSESRFSFRPDIVVLLHVLEHISRPIEFIRDVVSASASAGNSSPAIFIEVPNIRKCPSNDLSPFSNVEHLFNFSKSTLSLVLNRAGCDVLSVDEYDDRPIIRMIAMPSRSRDIYSSDSRLMSEGADELEVIKAICAKSEAFLADLESRVQALVGQIGRDRKKVIVYGAGVHTARLFDRFPNLLNYVVAVIDSDGNKVGLTIGGFVVQGVEALSANEHPVLISSYAYQEDISNFLADRFAGTRTYKLYETVVSQESFATASKRGCGT